MTRRSLLGLLLVGILLTSCGGQVAAGEPTADINLTVAAGAGTMVAAVFQTQTAIAPSATYTPLPSLTPLPSVTMTPLTLPTSVTIPTQAVIVVAASPTPTGTYYTATPLSSSLASGCKNLRLISSYTQPEGPFAPDQEFTQYWQVENNGSCEWLYVYQVVNVSGERMGGSPGRLGKKIEPGKWTTLSVNLDAPIDNGTYNATWRLTDGGGTQFGASLPVSIKVQRNPDPTATSNATQTIQAAVQQTSAAAAQATAVQAGVNTAVAATNAAAATATCGTLTAQGTPCP